MNDESGSTSIFEPPAWEERYSGDGTIWSGEPNAQLVAEASDLSPGTALDVGCGEGGDVIWLARRGWTVTGADFSAAGLARASRLAAEAGIAERTDWWQVDAREFEADGRAYDLVTTHYLHAPDGGMVDVVRRLTGAVAPGGHLLVVGHAPPARSHHHHDNHGEAERRAMFLAADLLPGLPEDFEPLVVEQRPRRVTRGEKTIEIDDSTLLARRAKG
ncbi:MAG: class I SAM-dependent methyltransferase [Actinobacteria bacterium]|nr:class I SAM-dependent methyltransferase [Actinomycetota bacterium]